MNEWFQHFWNFINLYSGALQVVAALINIMIIWRLTKISNTIASAQVHYASAQAETADDALQDSRDEFLELRDKIQLLIILKLEELLNTLHDVELNLSSEHMTIFSFDIGVSNESTLKHLSLNTFVSLYNLQNSVQKFQKTYVQNEVFTYTIEQSTTVKTKVKEYITQIKGLERDLGKERLFDNA